METRPKLKICGITNREDARLVSASGADYLGILVDVSFSERSLTLDRAREVARASEVPVVILLCDPEASTVLEVAREIEPYAIQLLCHEAPGLIEEIKPRIACQIWKTIHLPGPGSVEISPYKVAPRTSATLLCRDAARCYARMLRDRLASLARNDDRTMVRDYVSVGVDALLVDSADRSEGFLRMGGTGKVTDWQAAADVVRGAKVPVFLAGGIDPGNVRRAVREVRPYGIDLCSGVEAVKGKKDPEKVRTLVENLSMV